MTNNAIRFFALPFVAVALAVSAPAAAKAQGFKSARSGKTQWIDAYYGWNNDCSFKTINVNVVSKPKHGTVSPKVEMQRIKQAQIGSVGKCAGKPTKAVAVYYRSKPGYRGTDRFRIQMSVGGQSKYFNYTVNVR